MGKTRKNTTANDSNSRLTQTKTKPAARNLDVPDVAQSTALIHVDTYRRLYSGMLKCRMVAERVCATFGRQRASAKYKNAIGQEAAAVGTLEVLRPEDEVAPSARNFMAETVKGTPLKSVFGRILSESGRVRTSQQQLSRVSHEIIAPATVDAQVAVATGLALAHKIGKTTKVVVAMSVESWTDSDQLRATLSFAAGNRLPIIYVVNGHGADIAAEDRTGIDELTTLAHTCGVTAITVDGTDAVAVFRVASESVIRARKGVGPTLIDCKFLLVPQRIAAVSRMAVPGHLDPLTHMENYMRTRSAWSDEWKQRLVEQFTREIDSAVNFAKGASARISRGRERSSNR